MNELHEAAQKGNLKEMEDIIKANPESIKEQHSVTKCLPIAYAALSGGFDAVKLLLEKGSPTDVDFSPKKNSLMHFACMGGNIDIVNHFISLGFSLDKIKTHATLIRGSAGGHIELMKYLKKWNCLR